MKKGPIIQLSTSAQMAITFLMNEHDTITNAKDLIDDIKFWSSLCSYVNIQKVEKKTM